MTDSSRMKVTDVRVLAALAHPTRLAILHLLMTVGDSTATGCAAVVGESPSACSYHLRHLERFGLTSLEELPPLDVDVAARLAEEGGVAVASGPSDPGDPADASAPEPG